MSNVEWIGSYTDDNGDTVEARLTVEDRDSWLAYVPTLLAALNSGALDPEIYKIAKECHIRHVKTGGQAAQTRPNRDATQTAFAPVDPLSIPSWQILTPSNAIDADATAAPYFTFQGLRYGKNRVIGKYLHLPNDNLIEPAARGAFVQVLDATTTNLLCKVVGGSAHPKLLGSSIKVRFTDVPFIFGV